MTWWQLSNPTFQGERISGVGSGVWRTRWGWTLLRRQRLMLLLLLAVMIAIVAWSRFHRVDWGGDAAISVLLLELVPDGASITPTLRSFNGSPGAAPFDTTVQVVETFFADEYARYHPGERPHVELTVAGPYVVELDPPDMHDPDASATALLWRSLGYVGYFDELAERLGVDFGDYDVRAVAIFEPGYPYEQIEALSLASPMRRFGVVRLNLHHLDPTYSALTLLHELGHTFGASDKYDVDHYRARWPEGYADPHQQPLHPQQHAELMAGDVPLSGGGEREILDIDEVRIGVQTAYELGWVTWWERRDYYRDLPERPPWEVGTGEP